MGELIQITGLPRSGTAFMSVLMSMHPQCISYHELIAKSENFRSELVESQKKHKYVVDSSTVGYMENCVFEGSKKIFINRSASESLKSVKNAGFNDVNPYFYEEIVKKIESWKSKYEILEVKYENLFNPETLKSVWVYAFGSDEYFVHEKVVNMCDMRIEIVNPEFFMEQRIVNRINRQLCQQP